MSRYMVPVLRCSHLMRVSLSLYTAHLFRHLQTACTSRSFFNLFFSSSAEVFRDKAVFYAGSAHHPPMPFSTFTFLLDTSASSDGAGQLWLPSGENVILRSPSEVGGRRSNLPPKEGLLAE